LIEILSALADCSQSRQATLAQLVERLIRNFPFYVYAIDSVIGHTPPFSAYSA